MPTNPVHTTFSATNHSTFRYFARNRCTTMRNVATCSRKRAGCGRRFALLPSWQGSPALRCSQPSAGTAESMSASSTPTFPARISMSLTTPWKNERATFRMRNSQSYSLTTSHPSTRVKAALWNAPPQNNPTTYLRVTLGLAKPAPPKDIGGRIKSHCSRAICVLEGGGHTHLQRVGAGTLA